MRCTGLLTLCVLFSACGLDMEPPRVVAIEPGQGAVVDQDRSPLTLTFSEPVDGASARQAFSVFPDGGGSVSGQTHVSGERLVFTPDQAWEGGKTYRITVGIGTRDLADNPMDAEFYSSFYTGTNLLPFGVSFVSPTNMQAGVALTNSIRVSFSRSMDARSVRDCLSLSPQIDGDFQWNDHTNQLLFVPIGGLAPATHYTCTLGSAARDACGVPLGQDVVLHFFTGTNYARPRILGVFQIGATAAPIASRFWSDGYLDAEKREALVIDFDQEMDTAATEQAVSLVPAVDGHFQWRCEGENGTNHHQAIFYPGDGFALDTRYEVRVSSGARGINGLNPAAELRLNFTVSSNFFVVVTNILDCSNQAWAFSGITELSLDTNQHLVSLYFATCGGKGMDVAAVQESLALRRLFGSGDPNAQGRITGFNWSYGDRILEIELGNLARSNVYLLELVGGSSGVRDRDDNWMQHDLEVMFRVK